ncbi:MAG: glycosyltransferase [Candidatus Korarchaeum sp.]
MIAAEAIATGTPILASKFGGIPYLIEDCETGLLIDSAN